MQLIIKTALVLRAKKMTLSDDGKILLKVERSDIKEDGSFEVPKGVTSIGDYVFGELSGLKTLTLSERLTSIGFAAFFGCSGLQTFTFSKGLTSISVRAFSQCSGLQTIDLREGLTTINDFAFVGYIGLKTLVFPEGLTTIGVDAFFGCSGLETIVFSKQLTTIDIDNGEYIGNGAFSGCRGIKTLAFPEGFNLTNSRMFEHLVNAETVIILSENDVEIERIRQLLPNKLQDKVAPKAVYQCQQIQLSRLLSVPQLNPLYPLFDQGLTIDRIPKELFLLIQCYLEEVLSTYKQARERIFNEPIPKHSSEMIGYEKRLGQLVDESIEAAQALRQDNLAQAVESKKEGLGIMRFFQTEGPQNQDEPSFDLAHTGSCTIGAGLIE
jgi:hypothetical protein